MPLTAFFRGFEEPRSHQYSLLGHIDNSSGVIVEPYLITLTTNSNELPTFQREGIEFFYMLEGEVVYRHAESLPIMQPSDSLFFDADAPYGTEQLVKLPAPYLSVISYSLNKRS